MPFQVSALQAFLPNWRPSLGSPLFDLATQMMGRGGSHCDIVKVTGLSLRIAGLWYGIQPILTENTTSEKVDSRKSKGIAKGIENPKGLN
jgi:hypothetical protein